MKKGETKTEEWGNKFHITVNAPTLTALFMSVKISDMPVGVTAYKEAVEVGENGNLHKHLYIALERSWRRSALINRFKGAEVQRITPGTEATVLNYIGNDDKQVTKGCSTFKDLISIWGDIETSQGQRNDISRTDAVLWQVKAAVDADATWGELWQDFFPYMVKHARGLKEYYEYIRSKHVRADIKKVTEELHAKQQQEERESAMAEVVF